LFQGETIEVVARDFDPTEMSHSQKALEAGGRVRGPRLRDGRIRDRVSAQFDGFAWCLFVAVLVPMIVLVEMFVQMLKLEQKTVQVFIQALVLVRRLVLMNSSHMRYPTVVGHLTEAVRVSIPWVNLASIAEKP
jgi:hypothetical protein